MHSSGSILNPKFEGQSNMLARVPLKEGMLLMSFQVGVETMPLFGVKQVPDCTCIGGRDGITTMFLRGKNGKLHLHENP